MFEDIAQFMDAEGRVTAWPAKPKKQMIVLQYLIAQFAWGKNYTEKEVNDLLNRFHTFEDPALLRRELYMKHLVDRKADGSAYWRTKNSHE